MFSIGGWRNAQYSMFFLSILTLAIVDIETGSTNRTLLKDSYIKMTGESSSGLGSFHCDSEESVNAEVKEINCLSDYVEFKMNLNSIENDTFSITFCNVNNFYEILSITSVFLDEKVKRESENPKSYLFLHREDGAISSSLQNSDHENGNYSQSKWYPAARKRVLATKFRDLKSFRLSVELSFDDLLEKKEIIPKIDVVSMINTLFSVFPSESANTIVDGITKIFPLLFSGEKSISKEKCIQLLSENLDGLQENNTELLKVVLMTLFVKIIVDQIISSLPEALEEISIHIFPNVLSLDNLPNALNHLTRLEKIDLKGHYFNSSTQYLIQSLSYLLRCDTILSDNTNFSIQFLSYLKMHSIDNMKTDASARKLTEIAFPNLFTLRLSFYSDISKSIPDITFQGLISFKHFELFATSENSTLVLEKLYENVNSFRLKK